MKLGGAGETIRELTMQRHQLQGKAGALPAKLVVTLRLRQGSDACQRQAVVALAQRQHRGPHGCHLGGTLFWCPPVKHGREKRDELPHLRCRGLQNRWSVVKAIQAECFELVWHLLVGVVSQHLPPDALAPLLLVGAPALAQWRKRLHCRPGRKIKTKIYLFSIFIAMFLPGGRIWFSEFCLNFRFFPLFIGFSEFRHV